MADLYELEAVPFGYDAELAYNSLFDDSVIAIQSDNAMSTLHCVRLDIIRPFLSPTGKTIYT